MSIEEFHGLLGTLTSSDNAARQAAEATYNSTKESQPVTVLMFLAQTIQCPDEGLRAFAAVLFRRSCPELWRNPAVDAATKTTIKQLLIETIRQVCACYSFPSPASPAGHKPFWTAGAACELRVLAERACLCLTTRFACFRPAGASQAHTQQSLRHHLKPGLGDLQPGGRRAGG